jgi:ELWxxDGT repeat protein
VLLSETTRNLRTSLLTVGDRALFSLQGPWYWARGSTVQSADDIWWGDFGFDVPAGYGFLRGQCYLGPEFSRFNFTNLTAQVIKEINTNSYFSSSVFGDSEVPVDSLPQHFTLLGSKLYFIADDGTHGAELWRTDGTAAGTVLVKDIRSGEYGSRGFSFNSDQARAERVVVLGNSLLLAATGAEGKELWVSDGTTVGTQLLKDLFPGTASSWGANSGEPLHLTVAGSRAFFTAYTAATGRELWVTDGTPAGTVLVEDLLPGVFGGDPQQLTAVGDEVFFLAREGAGWEIWRSDGTPRGTEKVTSALGLIQGDPRELTAFNGRL